MKKWLTLLLAVVLAALLLAGCNQGQDPKPTEPVASNQETDTPTDEPDDSSEAPVDKGTITIGICQNTKVEDYDNNGFTKYLEELTGYDIVFDYFATRSDDAKTQLSTRIAGGEKLPDILYRFNIS